MPLLELSASTLSSLRLPAHIGRGDAAITRTARNESLFDVLTRLREDNEALQQRFAEPLEQPQVIDERRLHEYTVCTDCGILDSPGGNGRDVHHRVRV